MQKALPLPVDTPETYLPPMPTKRELADYFHYSKTESLYTFIITQEIIDIANSRIGVPILKMKNIKSERCKRIPPMLARVIYDVHVIESLR
ncbi:MAG: hypothetical protein AAFZ15_17265 [Bacteroidota bacterium]